MSSIKYTTKERNEAAEALAICASSISEYGSGELVDKDGQPYNQQDYDETLGFEGTDDKRTGAARLVDDAFLAVPTEDSDGFEIPLQAQYAEAESWVRSGWSEPGDEASFK